MKKAYIKKLSKSISIKNITKYIPHKIEQFIPKIIKLFSDFIHQTIKLIPIIFPNLIHKLT